METEKCDPETRLTMEMAGGVFLSQSSYNTLNKRLRRLHHLSGSEVVDLIKTEVLVPVRDLTWAPAFPPVPLDRWLRRPGSVSTSGPGGIQG